MKISITKNDLFWSYLGYFFTLFTNIIILPFVMKLVPANELGLWYTFLSIGQIVSIFDGTFAGSISRNITYAWIGIEDIQAEGFTNIDNNSQKPNYKLLISILSSCKVIFTMVSLASFVFMLTIGTAYIGYTAREIDNEIWIASWVIYMLAVFMNLYYSYWITALRGVGAMQQSQKVNVIAKIVQIIISLSGLFFNGGIIALALAYLISGIVLRLLGKRSFLRYESIGNEFNLYSNCITKDEIKSNIKKIWYNAKKNGLNCIGAFGITQSTTLFCSAYFGLEITASYGLCLQIITAMAGIALVYFNTMKPRITEYKINGGATRLQFINVISLAVSIYWVLFFIGLAAISFFGLPMIKMLKSNTEIPIVMLVFMGLYLFLENNHALFAGIIEMSNTVPYVKASVLSAVLIVIGEFIIVKYTKFGIYGLVSVQCVVQLCYNNWKWPSVIFKEYHLTPFSIIKCGNKEGLRLVKQFYGGKVNG